MNMVTSDNSVVTLMIGTAHKTFKFEDTITVIISSDSNRGGPDLNKDFTFIIGPFHVILHFCISIP